MRRAEAQVLRRYAPASAQRRSHNLVARRQGRASCVIPAFTEDRYIASLVLRIRREVDEVLVVDNGSNDETRTLASEAGATVLTHAVNRGKGAAIRTGLQWALAAQAEAAVLLDSDDQHHPDDIEPVLSS
jgi:glycosyltransferase involved in cell wall biosynthesis